MIRYLFAALALVAFIGALYHPEASAQFPPGICVHEFVTTVVSGVNVTASTCEERGKLRSGITTAFTGQPCTAPASGITLYAKLPDGTCLPVAPVAAVGFIASTTGVDTHRDSDGAIVAQTTYALVTPKP